LGKSRDPLEILRSEEGERFPLSGSRLPGCPSKEIEKSGRIRVARLQLVPQARELSGFEVAAD